MGRRADLDWPRIRAEYETGAYTLRALAERHGVKHTTIHQRIKRDGWTQDPSGEVRRLRSAKLAQLDASEQAVDNVRRPVADAAAERQVDVIASHRRLTQRLRGNVERILDLVHQYLHGDEEERNAAMVVLKLGSGDSLTGHLNSLSTTIERIVRLERASYGISDIEEGMNASKAEALRVEIHERLARLADGG